MGDGEWRQQLPEDLRGNEAFSKMEKLGDLATAYLDLGKSKLDLETSKTDLEGKLENAIQIPGEKASDEERATFFGKLGRPEKPEGYEFKKPDLPEEIPYDEKRVGEYRKLAHELGLTPAQAARIHDWYHQEALKSFQDIVANSEKQKTEATEALKKDWGDKFEENVEIARRVAKLLGEKAVPGLYEMVKPTEDGGAGLGNNPVIIKLFHVIGKQVMDDKTILGSLGGETEKSAAEVLYPEMKKAEG